jgi:hypothetical protein
MWANMEDVVKMQRREVLGVLTAAAGSELQGKRQQQFPPQKHRENRRKAKAATATLFGGRRG